MSKLASSDQANRREMEKLEGKISQLEASLQAAERRSHETSGELMRLKGELEEQAQRKAMEHLENMMQACRQGSTSTTQAEQISRVQIPGQKKVRLYLCLVCSGQSRVPNKILQVSHYAKSAAEQDNDRNLQDVAARGLLQTTTRETNNMPNSRDNVEDHVPAVGRPMSPKRQRGFGSFDELQSKRRKEDPHQETNSAQSPGSTIPADTATDVEEIAGLRHDILEQWTSPKARSWLDSRSSEGKGFHRAVRSAARKVFKERNRRLTFDEVVRVINAYIIRDLRKDNRLERYPITRLFERFCKGMGQPLEIDDENRGIKELNLRRGIGGFLEAATNDDLDSIYVSGEHDVRPSTEANVYRQ